MTTRYLGRRIKLDESDTKIVMKVFNGEPSKKLMEVEPYPSVAIDGDEYQSQVNPVYDIN